MIFKKIISIISILFLLMTLPVTTFATSQEEPLTLFGINFSEVWNYIAFWKDDTSEKTPSNSKTPSTSTPPKDFNITVDNQIYSGLQIAYSINSKEEFAEYIKKFNYECISIETDKAAKLTLKFNTNTGKVTSIKNSLSCERKIFVEESLITDIKKEGFEKMKIKSYLERVELPTSMYFKAIKVLTVG